MADLTNSWKTLTQEYLNWAYDQSQHSSNMNELLDRYKLESVLVREEIGYPSRYIYGSTDDEGIDVYIPKTSKHNGAVIFMHGGAWKTGFAENYSFFAKPFLDLGYAVFIPDFANVVTLNGNLSLSSPVRADKGHFSFGSLSDISIISVSLLTIWLMLSLSEVINSALATSFSGVIVKISSVSLYTNNNEFPLESIFEIVFLIGFN